MTIAATTMTNASVGQIHIGRPRRYATITPTTATIAAIATPPQVIKYANPISDSLHCTLQASDAIAKNNDQNSDTAPAAAAMKKMIAVATVSEVECRRGGGIGG